LGSWWRGELEGGGGKLSTPTSHPRRHVSFSDIWASYGLHFEIAMRMSADAFYDLADRLRPRLPHRGAPPEVRIAIVLLDFGGGSYLDNFATLGVHTCTVHCALWDVVDAVNSTPFLEMDFQLSSSPRRLAYAPGLRSRRNSPFGNVREAVDEIAVEKEQPLATDAPRVEHYCTRKSFYALKNQAISDSEYKFCWMACSSPGVTVDSTAFSRTSLGRQLSDRDSVLTLDMTRDGHRIAADGAYAAREGLAVPRPGVGQGYRWRDAFHFYLSSLRVYIEQGIGMLLWRWGVFWRPLRVPFAKRPSLVRARFRLHKVF